MTRQTFRNIAATGLVGLTAFLGGCLAVQKPENICDPFLNPVNADAPADNSSTSPIADNEFNWNKKSSSQIREIFEGAHLSGCAVGRFGTKFLQDYRVIGEGPVAQAGAVLERKDNVFAGDSLGVGAFGNYDIHAGELVEADFAIEGKIPVPVGNLFGGYDNPCFNDSVFAGYQYRHYQNGLLGAKGKDFGNHIVEAGFKHSSKLDLRLEVLGLVPDANTSDGYLFRFTGSKKWNLGKVGDRDLCVRPFVNTGYGIDWYGINSWTAVNSGVNVTFEKNHSIFGGRIECQSSLNDKVDNVLYAGVETGVRF